MLIQRVVVSGMILLAMPMVAAGAAQAGTSSFARDRNLPVATRVPRGYEAQGIRVRSFIVSPRIDLNVQHDDNILYSATNKQADTILSVAPSIGITSDWSRHQIAASVSGTYNDFLSHSAEDTVFASAALGGRLDVHGNSNLFGGVNISQNYEPRYSPSAARDTAKPIKYDATVADLGFVLEGNRLRLTGRTDYSKLNYFDVAARDPSLGIIDQDGRDYTLTSGTLRADYAFSPDTSFYIVYTGNKRDYRLDVSKGRDSHGYDAALGVSFDLTNLITGELQYGYLQQTYQSPLYPKAKGPSYKATVSYFPTQLMTITLKTARSVEETPQVNASGYLSSNTAISVDHELLRRLILSASYNPISDRYLGVDRRDKRQIFYIGAKYFLMPRVILKGGYTYADLKSSGAAAISPYKDNSINVALTYQY